MSEDAVPQELPLEVPPILRPEIVEDAADYFSLVIGPRDTRVVLEDVYSLHRELVVYPRAFVEVEGRMQTPGPRSGLSGSVVYVVTLRENRPGGWEWMRKKHATQRW
jgi:hypothetical protein